MKSDHHRSSQRPSSGEPAESQGSAPRRWWWFRHEREGRLVGRDEFEKLPAHEQAQLAVRIDRYLKGISRRKDVANLGDGIYELRYRRGNNHYRVLFTRWGPDCVGLTAFYKNQQQTPKPDKDRAVARAKRWRVVFGQGPPKVP